MKYCEMLKECWFSNLPDKFDFSLYVTKATNTAENQMSSFSNLIRTRTHAGRPDWRALFMDWALLYHKKEVTVFTCGPPSLHQQVKAAALKYNAKGSRFRCVQETFS